MSVEPSQTAAAVSCSAHEHEARRGTPLASSKLMTLPGPAICLSRSPRVTPRKTGEEHPPHPRDGSRAAREHERSPARGATRSARVWSPRCSKYGRERVEQGAGEDAQPVRRLAEASPGHDAGEHVAVAAEELGRAVQHEAAPCSSGRCRTGVAKVESTITGTLRLAHHVRDVDEIECRIAGRLDQHERGVVAQAAAIVARR